MFFAMGARLFSRIYHKMSYAQRKGGALCSVLNIPLLLPMAVQGRRQLRVLYISLTLPFLITSFLRSMKKLRALCLKKA